jgi:hypothetical protein
VGVIVEVEAERLKGFAVKWVSLSSEMGQKAHWAEGGILFARFQDDIALDVGSKRRRWSDGKTAEQVCDGAGRGAKMRKTQVIGSNRSE